MKAEKRDGDYYIYLTEADISELGMLSIDWSCSEPLFHPPLSVNVSGDMVEPETMTLSFSISEDKIHGINAHDGILFEKGENGPVVEVSPAVVEPLLEGGYAVTRYDGYEKKIWFQRDWEGELEEGEDAYLPQEM